jgi:hypothetical protein
VDTNVSEEYIVTIFRAEDGSSRLVTTYSSHGVTTLNTIIDGINNAKQQPEVFASITVKVT